MRACCNGYELEEMFGYIDIDRGYDGEEEPPDFDQ